MAAYYNEIDPFAAAWLRNLISAGLIAPGEVDERSIEDVTPDDLRGFSQCHFFAGIGVWSHALQLAGWPDDRPIWTGSCPCQPFSAAGKRGGTADARHLWPAFHHLIDAARPAVVVGEQVASKDGLAWLDTVHADLEASGYAVGATDLCAAGVGAPHIRQRLWFVGVADGDGGDACAEGLQRSGEHGQQPQDGGAARLEHTPSDGRIEGRPESIGRGAAVRCGEGAERPGPTNGFWRDADWLLCRDERWRPVRPGSFPLVNGAPARVGRLLAYGNAIVAEAAREFIEAVDWSIGGDLA